MTIIATFTVYQLRCQGYTLKVHFNNKQQMIHRILVKNSPYKNPLFRLIDPRKSEEYPAKIDVKWEMNKELIAKIVGGELFYYQSEPDPDGVFCLQARNTYDYHEDERCLELHLLLLKWPGGAFDIHAACRVNDDAWINKNRVFSIEMKGYEENPKSLQQDNERMEAVPLKKLTELDSYTVTVNVGIRDHIMYQVRNWDGNQKYMVSKSLMNGMNIMILK